MYALGTAGLPRPGSDQITSPVSRLCPSKASAREVPCINKQTARAEPLESLTKGLVFVVAGWASAVAAAAEV